MSLFFVLAAVLAVAGALGVIFARPPVHSLLALIMSFAALAGLYLTLSAEFLALIQIIVYAGAIMVLFLFVIGLLTAGTEPVESDQDRLPWQRTAATGAVALAAIVVIGTAAWTAARPPEAVGGDFGTIRVMGEALFLSHVFPLQLAALVLLVAAVGVAMLIGRRRLRGS